MAKVFVGNASLLTQSHPPLPQTMEVASVSLGLVSTQTPLISCSTCLAKLPLFQKAAAVVVIVDFARIFYGEQKEGAFARDELNI